MDTIAPSDSVHALGAAGVRVLSGTAMLTAAGRLDVDGTPVTFRSALVATGASPAVPAITGLDAVRYLTSDTVWSLTDLPITLVVLRGSSVGCELAQAFARLGSEVTLVEGADQLLPREDCAAAGTVADALRDDGAEVRLGRAVTKVDPGAVTVDDGTRIGLTELLVAVGRRPRTAGLGLDVAGVRSTPGGMVAVDRTLRTTNRPISAAGDLTGHPQGTAHGHRRPPVRSTGPSRSATRRATPAWCWTAAAGSSGAPSSVPVLGRPSPKRRWRSSTGCGRRPSRPPCTRTPPSATGSGTPP